MSQQKNPYSQRRENNLIVRTFTQDIDENELVWHRDKKDREIKVLEETDWMFQFDNELPQIIKDIIFIPKNTYHRVIKGTNNLNITILEY
jgi:hypothetical protein